jgi:hydroxyethylthiazole kinase
MLGNVLWDDGGNFKGRGMKQLTGRANYAEYWVYRGWLLRSTYSDNWWRHVGWWGIPGNANNYNHANDRNRLPIQPNTPQNQNAVTLLIQQRRPPIINDQQRITNDVFTCIDTAGFFWAKNSPGNRLLYWANRNDHLRVTNIINGGTNGLAQRTTESDRIRAYLGDTV